MSTLDQGLKQSEVDHFHTQFGFNEISDKGKRTILRILVHVIKEPMFSLLLLAALVYVVIGSLEDATLLGIFIALSIGITVYQENKSEKAIQALKDLSSPRALVIRDGEIKRIAGKDVVIGDLLILEEGDRISADAKLLRSNDLLVDESLLTGESDSVEKKMGDLIFSGSLVVRGGGTATVQSIGTHTELGKIGKSLLEIEDPNSPLQNEIKALIKRFSILGISLSILVCLTYGFLYNQWLDGVLSGISLTMALLPEEFTLVLMVFMALGVWRISRQHVLTRKTSVIETLGSITVLCVDKTGTLTLNRMSLQAIASPQQILYFSDSATLDQQSKEILSYSILASEVEPYDPMEKAFTESAITFHQDHHVRYKEYQIAHEYSFTPDLPAMAHVWRHTKNPEDCLIAMKGSPEVVMSLCHLSESQKLIITKQIHEMASQGLRLLGVAKCSYRKTNGQWPQALHDISFEWLGLVGLKDPLRKEVPASIQQCHEAGIRVLMITGDHALTAKAIAQQAGIESDRILSGNEIDSLSDDALRDSLDTVQVFVRIKPAQKLRLVQALQAKNEIVGMTGDGVNDAPALKAAHVGISMGQRGTDVAREASSLVLLNDDFSSIVNAIRQGRQIHDNLQKAIVYVVAGHVPIAGAILIPLLFGLPPLLYPIHILFLEMIIDPSCAIVFEAETPESNLMKQPPRDSNKKIFSLNNFLIGALQGFGLLAIVMAVYFLLIWNDHPQIYANTVAFGILVLGNLMLVVVSRSRCNSIFKILKNPNPSQYWIMGIAISLFVGFTFLAFFKERFRFTELSIEMVGLILSAVLIGILWFELVKATFRRISRFS